MTVWSDWRTIINYNRVSERLKKDTKRKETILNADFYLLNYDIDKDSRELSSVLNSTAYKLITPYTERHSSISSFPSLSPLFLPSSVFLPPSLPHSLSSYPSLPSLRSSLFRLFIRSFVYSFLPSFLPTSSFLLSSLLPSIPLSLLFHFHERDNTT